MQHLTDDQLFDMIDALTTEEEMQGYTAHLSVCEDCQSRHQAFAAVHAQLERLPLLQPSIVFTERVLDQWDDIRLAVPKKRTPRVPFVFMALMGMLLFSCVTILIFASESPSGAIPVGTMVESLSDVAGSELFWKSLLLGNAMLLLWVFNQRILKPLFRSRMAL